jgi:hypothetical protein
LTAFGLIRFFPKRIIQRIHSFPRLNDFRFAFNA